MDQPTVIDISNRPVKDGRWTDEQHRKFLEGLRKHGKDWKMIETIVRTRTGSQIRSHAQKYFNKLDRHRQLAWNPDSSGEKRSLKGILRHRSGRQHQEPRTAPTRKNEPMSSQISEPSFDHAASSPSWAETSSQPQSFFNCFIRPLLSDPYFMNNFLTCTTDIGARKERSRQKTPRRNSFELLEDNHERQRSALEARKATD